MPYPESDSKFTEIKRFLRIERVNSIMFSTYPVQKLFPLDIRFTMSEQESRKEVQFRHPVTGRTHTVYFQAVQPIEIPLEEAGGRILYAMRAMYEIAPALPEGEQLRFDSSVRQTQNPPEGAFLPASVSSIGIIGGADGPTAIFLGGGDGSMKKPLGKHGLPLHSCLSIPAFRNDEPAGFFITGIRIRKYDSVEYSFGDS